MFLIYLTGLPFSGKTTLAREIVQATGAVYVSVDESAGSNWGTGNTAWIVGNMSAGARVIELLGQGQSVVWDSVGAERRRREHYRSIASHHGAKAVGVYLESDRETMLARVKQFGHRASRADVPNDDYEWVFNLYQIPEPDEDMLGYSRSVPMDLWVASVLLPYLETLEN